MKLPTRYSVMLKLVALFLLALCPLGLLYVSSHQLSRNMLMRETMASIQRRNQDFSDRLHDELSRILSTNHMLSTNWELGKLSVVPEGFTVYEKAQAISNIQDKIFLAQLSSRFIGDIHVYISKMDKCISTSATSSTRDAMRVLAANIDSIACDQFITHNGHIVLISQNTFGDTSQPSLVVQTVLSVSSINGLFNQASDGDVSRGFLFNLSDGQSLSEHPASDLEQALIARVSEVLKRTQSAQIQSGMLDVQLGDTSYKVSYTYLPYGDVAQIRYFDQADIGIGFGQMQNLLILFAVAFAVVFLLIYYSLYRLVDTPLRLLLGAFEQVELGDLSVSIAARDQGEFKYIYEGFNSMVCRIKTLIDHTYQQTIYVQRAQLKQLQAQIDPHFLYNGFFILNKRIRAQDTRGALDFSQALSEYFRYVTQNAQDVVPLRDEVEHAYNYARIQQVRFSNRLTLEFEPLPEVYAQLRTPRLILQPVFENVFKHVLDKMRGQLVMRVCYEMCGDALEIRVEDSGDALTDEALIGLTGKLHEQDHGQEVSGLVNVHRRLQLYDGEDFGLRVDRSVLGGLLVQMRMRAMERSDA